MSSKGAVISMPEELTQQTFTQCARCSSALDSRWSFCPRCGVAISAAVPEKREKSSARDALGGMLFGALTAPVCLIVGGMLCCTGLGAFAGVPLILLGILAPLLGTVLGLYELHGKCPWCGTSMISLIHHPHDAACPVCGKIIAIHAEKLEKTA
jgi:tRNA(Ile2) C34 agmatinyltransferase TiaS